MSEILSDDYDPFIVAAANRAVVRLEDGRCGRLAYWSKTADRATVIIDRRHIKVSKDDVKAIVQSTQ